MSDNELIAYQFAPGDGAFLEEVTINRLVSVVEQNGNFAVAYEEDVADPDNDQIVFQVSGRSSDRLVQFFVIGNEYIYAGDLELVLTEADRELIIKQLPQFLAGHTGQFSYRMHQFLESGYIYAPYIPIHTTIAIYGAKNVQK